MKTYKYILILFIFLLCERGFGQANEGRESIEAARIALITERLGLTPEQAEKLWKKFNSRINIKILQPYDLQNTQELSHRAQIKNRFRY